mmetsp:Transcript_2188/g.4028  ORF Transcript_2188/g.4028 Transcript_2188/m.4028 type:complete len:104 (+) Transcript_2188:185-496(+)
MTDARRDALPRLMEVFDDRGRRIQIEVCERWMGEWTAADLAAPPRGRRGWRAARPEGAASPRLASRRPASPLASRKHARLLPLPAWARGNGLELLLLPLLLLS